MALALYRTYRPGSFADVVGQEHVTGPLTRALENDRVHHAYLFSGPRGCGKTSSARILARSLNCEQGPTPTPCGRCRSCTDLAPNGPGSLDVVELDAATHGLVDDARDLREKAHFAPVSCRFKIYIIDEAHQLGPGAANALLKIIEEPPAHLKFVFATTAPDKILATIRSRTHHYPFRLIPARTLQAHLARVCEAEGVPIEPAALALVARAGAGSARDALSVLGQLIAGSGPEGVTYDLAVALLGFTDATLLDEVVDAVAAHDGATLFATLDRVMESGHDPRRFLTDLLERLRDLVVVRAVPDAAGSGLIEAPDDAVARMSAQAARFGPTDLVRLADVVDAGITAMKGATPTRLQLELVCARLLLPGADDSAAGLGARLDRLERRLALGEAVPPAPPVATAAAPPAEVAEAAAARRSPAAAQPAPRPAAQPAPRPASQPAPGPAAQPAAGPAPPAAAGPAPAAAAGPAPAAAAGPSPAAAGPSPAAAGPGVADLRRMWPEVLERLREIKRTPWSLISQECGVADVRDGVLTLAFRKSTLRDTFLRREDFQTYLRQAVADVLGVDLRVEAVVDPSAEPSPTPAGDHPPQSPAPRRPAEPPPAGDPWPDPGTPPSPGSAPSSLQSGPTRSGARPSHAPAAGDRSRGRGARAAGRADADPVAERAPDADQLTDQRPGDAGPHPGDAGTWPDDAGAHRDDSGPHPDDQDLEEAGGSQRELLQRALGAQVIEEIEHS